MRLSDVYDSDAEQERLAAVLDPRYEGMLVAVHRLVESALPELSPEDFRLDDEAVRAILAEAAERVVLIDTATRQAIREQLQEGQKRGYSAHEIAYGVPVEDYRGIDHLFTTTWKGRAETVARTELGQAQNVASLDRYAATGLVERVELVENEDTDEPCASRNGKVVPLSERPGLLHPNCLPGDQLVWAPEVTGATSREFEGELVTLRTAADDLLTCTPNHPVLTPHGWVAAHLLTEGEYVFRCPVAQGEPVVGALHDNEVPARIEEIAGALAMAVGSTALSVPGATPDFHGDGRRECHVDVVWADRFDQRSVRCRVGLEEPGPHLPVEATDAEAAVFSSDRALELALEAVRPTPGGGVGRHRDRRPLLLGRSAHAVVHGLTGRARQASRLDPIRGCAVGDAEHRADGGAGQAVIDVEAAQFLWGRPVPAAQVVAVPPQAAVEGRRSDAGLFRHDVETAYLEVTPVQLIQVGQKHFAGHVFNLETRQGWYVAEGIVTHNCRLGLIPVVEVES